MEKLKKILKVPALIASLAIFLAFMITLIVTCTRSFSYGEYIYENSANGEKFVLVLDLDDDEEGELTETQYTIGDIDVQKTEFIYKVVDGRLYCALETTPSDFDYVADINPFEMKIGTVIAKNKGAIALKVCSIVFMSVFGVSALASGVYIYLSKKKSNKPKKVESNQKVEPEVEPKTEE